MKKQTDSQRRSEAWEKDKITREESKAAMEMQSPVIRPIDESQHETKALSRVSTFMQLAKVSRSARLAFGGNSPWLKPEMLFRQDYRDGLESVPFIITKAFQYTRKFNSKPGLGIEIMLSDGKMYNVGFNLNDGDSKRHGLIEMFRDRSAQPIGPFMIIQLHMPDQPNAYYDIVPYEKEALSQSDPEIPFVEISLDPDTF